MVLMWHTAQKDISIPASGATAVMQWKDWSKCPAVQAHNHCACEAALKQHSALGLLWGLNAVLLLWLLTFGYHTTPGRGGAWLESNLG